MAVPRKLDDLVLYSLREDPQISEQMIVGENERAKTDELSDRILKSVYWEADREAAFARYFESSDFKNTLKLINTFDINPSAPLVEIGGGSGFLSWALTRSGFQDVSLLEPNPNFITGTGYLQTRADSKSITIENSLDRFYESSRSYETVVTRNCIHHFPNITFVAACIRQKLKDGGKWVVIREPYVETAIELYQFLQGHPYSQGYGIYEFGFPASHFINCIEMAGFELSAVVPATYANDALAMYSEEQGSTRNRLFTKTADMLLKRLPSATCTAYRIEQLLRAISGSKRSLFTKPQVMLFEKTDLGELSPATIWYQSNATSQSVDASSKAA
ncbi:class I SAM-dependent methyltransferase [Rhodopirellula sp. MGV]|uniref:class I SAM-dependent methyltransferase n=1 Tax=Rhodopirellula sp. MGV TaxID=2023130 RepID=UPI0013040537|nr:class I SAM-dependent methyltransferase [Rhodopirellula sp. MGV]